MKGSKKALLNNLRILSDDREALYLANYVEANDEQVEIYVEHVLSEAQVMNFIVFGVVDKVMGEKAR